MISCVGGVLINTPGPPYDPKRDPGAFNALDPARYPQLQGKVAIHLSPDGTLRGAKVSALQVHLAGGNCGECLTRTVRSLLQDFLRGPNPSLKVIVHRSLVFGHIGGWLGQPLVPALFPNPVVVDDKPVKFDAHTTDHVHYRFTPQGFPGKAIEFEVVP